MRTVSVVFSLNSCVRIDMFEHPVTLNKRPHAGPWEAPWGRCLAGGRLGRREDRVCLGIAPRTSLAL